MATKRPRLQRMQPDSVILATQNAPSLSHWRSQATYVNLN